MDISLNSIVQQIIEQVPALALFVIWSIHLSRSGLKRDELYVTSMKDVRNEMRDIAASMRTLADQLKQDHANVCQFHDDFQRDLTHIKKAVGKND